VSIVCSLTRKGGADASRRAGYELCFEGLELATMIYRAINAATR
jgi:hypothetical protein